MGNTLSKKSGEKERAEERVITDSHYRPDDDMIDHQHHHHSMDDYSYNDKHFLFHQDLDERRRSDTYRPAATRGMTDENMAVGSEGRRSSCSCRQHDRDDKITAGRALYHAGSSKNDEEEEEVEVSSMDMPVEQFKRVLDIVVDCRRKQRDQNSDNRFYFCANFFFG